MHELVTINTDRINVRFNYEIQIQACSTALIINTFQCDKTKLCAISTRVSNVKDMDCTTASGEYGVLNHNEEMSMTAEPIIPIGSPVACILLIL